MIIFWLINIALWSVFAKYNYELLFKTKNFHAWGAIVSGIFALLVACMINYAPENRYVWENDFLFHFVLDLTIPVYMFMSLTIRWNVFDPVLNYMMDKPFWYWGNMMRDVHKSKPYFKNGTIDRTLKLWQIPIKIIFLIISIYLSICIL